MASRSLERAGLQILGAAILFMALSAGARAETEVRGELRRRGWLGAQLTPSEDGHPAITKLLPGGSLSAKLKEGDVLQSIDGKDVAGPGAVAAALGPKRAGDVATFLVLREGTRREFVVELIPLPFERSEDFEILYDVVEAQGQRLRSTLTRPRAGSGRLPAVLFIQGLQCAPVDEPVGEPSTVLQLIHALTSDGYVVMRCEKRGAGDATGEPCSELGFHDEVAGFRAALAKLLAYDFVDPEQVFLFGHSMGGIEAPILATEIGVRGVIVFGTAVLPWAEYLVENERRQTRLQPGADLPALETKARQLADFLHESFRNKKSPAEVVAARPDLEAVSKDYFPDGVHCFGRHIDFYRELDSMQLADVWARVEAPVLAIHGSLDYTTSTAEHEYIAEIVNSKRPGTALALVIPGMFHAFNLRASVQETLDAPWQGPLGDEVVQQILDWMGERRQG
jgi:pimeloyl-ACP methyl ester carboxylesterase